MERLFESPFISFMAEPKNIDGKKDDAKHDGRYSNVKREQEATQHLKEALEDLASKPQIKPDQG